MNHLLKPLKIMVFLFATHLGLAQVDVDIELVEHASGFNLPVDITHAGDDRLFVVQKAGLVRILNADGNIEPTPFLDISSLTSTAGQNDEQGFLGLTFHPNYAENGFLYVNYTRTNGDTRVSRFTVSEDNANVVDPTSREDIITITQPYWNHNGGCLKFGSDGYLYIGMGDGGSGGDPDNYSQSMDELLGKMLRIDVNGEAPYEIPEDNPFVGTGADTLPEIWASGLRNPWRFSFDRQTGDMYIGDVGQGNWEEIDYLSVNSSGGENYGWRCYEGTHAYNTSGCAGASSYVSPISEYSHNSGGCSVTGGYVYRGLAYPNLQGKYFYTDYCSGKFWSAEQNDADEWVIFEVTGNEGFGWSSFGENAAGELFVLNQSEGKVYRITDPCEGLSALVEQAGNTLTTTLQGNSYQWHLDGDAISNATSSEYEIEEDGVYTVVITTANGCNVVSEPLFASFSGVEDYLTLHGVSLIENPVSEQLFLRSNGKHIALIQAHIYDAMGREMKTFSFQPVAGVHEQEITGLPSGQYILRLQSEMGESQIRFTRLKN